MTLTTEAKKLWQIFQHEGIGDGINAMVRFMSGIFGRNLRLPYLQWRNEGNLVMKSIHGNTMFLDLSDPGISRTLLTKGVHEYKATQVFRREIEPGMVHIDVGANIGYYALQAASLVGDSGTVVAIEPVETNIELLRRNIEANGFENITVHNFAVSNQRLSMPMTVTDKSNRGTLLDTEASDVSSYIEGELEKRKEATTEVQTVTLDDLLSEDGIDDFDMLRMDIEGYEIKAIEGMEHLLKNSSPPCKLFIEVHPKFFDNPEKSIGKMIETIQSYGFEPRLVINQHLVHTDFDPERFSTLVCSFAEHCPHVLFEKSNPR